MNRQIKFRGKRTDTGELVYGDLIHGVGSKHGRMYILPITHIYPKGCNELDGWEVIPDTVGQYWRTVNSQDLYDGDIFTVNGKYPKVVRWIEEKECFCMANISELDYDWMDAWQQPALDWFDDFKRSINVIGSVHDNPELLKGGEE